MKYLFGCALHEEYGTLGWRLEGHPGFDPISGNVVPHDILEHPVGNGSPEDEFMAHGAMVYLRWETGLLHGKSPFLRTLASNLYGDLNDVMDTVIYDNDGQLLPCPSNGQTPVASTYSDTVDSEIRDHVKAGICYLQNSPNYAHPRNSPDWPFFSRDWEHNIIGWMRSGYRWAQKRYRPYDRYGLASLFEEIAKESDRHLNSAEEGDLLEIGLCLRRCSFRAKLIPNCERNDY